MKISFFEEFTTLENLNKLKLVTFPTRLFLADYSVEGFKAIRDRINNPLVKECIYWPILNMHEGYWFSRFTKRNALLRQFNILMKVKVPVMIDLELPFLTKKLFFTEFFKSFKNSKYLKGFIQRYFKRVYTANYFNCKVEDLHHKPIVMMYSSMLKVTKEKKKEKLEALHKQFEDRLLAGLGAIGTGILGNEKQLSLEQLREDLELCKELKIKEVVIYRLGGLDEEYIEVIKEFS
jgi:hypothetical protein